MSAQQSITIADPSGNITAFVHNGRKFSSDERINIAKALLSDTHLHIEQVGFVLESRNQEELWHLEMMGGEFCGNAARSFGLMAAKKLYRSGKRSIVIEVSGSKAPVSVDVDLETNYAAAQIQAPVMKGVVDYGGKKLPLYVFEGITHVIANDIKVDKNVFFAIKTKACSSLAAINQNNNDAFGVMFFDTKKNLMTPAVYVEKTDSLVFESSCGSGSAAYICDSSESLACGQMKLAIKQPGGTLDTLIEKENHSIRRITIGGIVTLSERLIHDGR